MSGRCDSPSVATSCWCSPLRSPPPTRSPSAPSSSSWRPAPPCSRPGRRRAWIPSRPSDMSRLLVLAFLLLAAPVALALDGNAILQQVDRKLNPESYEMYRKLINVEPDGRRKEIVLFTVKQGRDKMVALF